MSKTQVPGAFPQPGESPAGHDRKAAEFWASQQGQALAARVGRNERIAVLAIGAALILLRLIVPSLPVIHGLSLNQASGLCSSGLGIIGRALSQQVSIGCARVAWIMDGLNIAAVLGAAALAWGGYQFYKHASRGQQ